MTKIIEMILDESELNPTGVFALSFVDKPANDVEFIYMSKEQHILHLSKVDEEKHMIYSPVLIPNQKILRYNLETLEPYFMFFSKETIETLASNYLKNHNQTSFTYLHNEYVDGVLLVEQWLTAKDNDKSKSLGFDLPEGTWMVGLKVTNTDIWEKVKEGIVNGISIEASMQGYIVKNSAKDICEILENILKDEQN